MKFHVLLALALTCVTGFSQETLQSPEVHADKAFTLRLSAPKASEVTVAGEWNLNKPQALSKDDKGVWAIKVGPVPPNIYIYTFNVDGVTITDPINPSVKLRARTSASMVHIPGEQPRRAARAYRDQRASIGCARWRAASDIRIHSAGLL